jgi:hypothetical protein
MGLRNMKGKHGEFQVKKVKFNTGEFHRCGMGQAWVEEIKGKQGEEEDNE